MYKGFRLVASATGVPSLSAGRLYDGANTVELASREIKPSVYAVIPTEAYDKVPRGLPGASKRSSPVTPTCSSRTA